jgi:uncharacterized membrane protein
MQKPTPFSLSRLLTCLTILLIWKVTLSVVLEYRNYLPPNFDSDFLLGRKAYFWNGYHWAFYLHIVSGPVALLLGALLMSQRFRTNWPKWHRRMGRVQVGCVLLLVAPSGLSMSYYALTGAVAGAGLGLLAVATAACIALGWRAAVKRNFVEHRCWMTRTFILLCSAVVIRLIGGLATVTQLDAVWVYPLAAWLSWLLPLAVYEASRLIKPRTAGASPVSMSVQARSASE